MHQIRLGERFATALTYAYDVHQGQWRKKTHAPYISHPLGVASLALEHGADEDEAIAALLHDAVEDGGGRARLEDIRERFGEHVADVVYCLSDWIEGLDGPRGTKQPWKTRKRRYLERMGTADDSCILVSAADKLHNARAIARDYSRIGDDVFERFTAGKDGTCWYYRQIVRVLRGRAPAEMMQELERAVGVFAADDMINSDETCRTRGQDG